MLRESWLLLQEEYKKSWEKFMAGEEVTELPNPAILESWRRCAKYKVDPAQPHAKVFLDKNQLEKLRQKNEMLIQTSLPMLENLYEYFKGTGFTVVLSEENGYLIKVFGDKKITGLSQQGKWATGACWSEESAGTNVIGFSLYTGCPISLTGYECYCHYSLNWCGAGAPIHDPSGKIIGAVGLAGLIRDYNHHTLGMVIAATKAIEIQLSMKKTLNERAVSDQYNSAIVNSIYEGLLAVDQHNVITMVNRRGQELLDTPDDALVGIHINELFSNSLLDYLKGRDGQLVDIQDEVRIGNKRIKCTITCQRVMVNGEYRGLIIVLNKIERTKKLIDKMLNDANTKTFADIIGNNSSFQETLELAKTVAPLKSNVLLLGESGTGKDIFAQAIHNASFCRLGPLVAVNCGAIPKDLIGSELFGYSEGTFTGGVKGGKKGKFEYADGGTLFLDEIGEMPAEQQKLLLRVLEEKRVCRLGSNEMIPVDVRIIAATNKDLQFEVAIGNFRRDLYYRLAIFTIEMLPLKARKDDIKLLAKDFLSRKCAEIGVNPVEIDEDVFSLLCSYDWPGNVRELYNSLERALILSNNQKLTARMFDIPISSVNTTSYAAANQIQDELNQYEADLLRDLLRRNDWNISRASLEMGVSRTTIYRKIRLYEITIPNEFRNKD